MIFFLTVGLRRHGEDGGGGSSGVLSEDGHLVGVAAELLDVLLHPLEHHDLVLDAKVAGGEAVPGGEEAEGPQAVVEGDEDDVVLQQVVGAEEVGGSSAHDESPAVDVDHDGALLLVQLRGVDVEEEAVLVSGGLALGDVVLRAQVAVLGRIVLVLEGQDLDGGLQS